MSDTSLTKPPGSWNRGRFNVIRPKLPPFSASEWLRNLSGSRPYRQTYTYEPLTEARDIRLLVLDPGVFSEPVRCYLIHCSLEDHPDYEALSYTWGDGVKTEVVSCGNDTLLITANLNSALRHLRRLDRICILWAEAVCIDQSNNEERSTQVMLMGDIFAKAEGILVWLGERTKDDAFAFDLMRKIFAETQKPRFKDVFSSSWDDDARGFPPPQSALWSTVASVFERPWFCRLWVVQELALRRERYGATVICGDLKIPWQVIRAVARIAMEREAPFAKSILYVGDDLRDGLVCAVVMEEFFGLKQFQASQYHGPPVYPLPSLLDVLRRTCLFRVTDERDRIYGVLGLMDATQRDMLKPDYDLSVEGVHISATVCGLVLQKDLKYLQHAGQYSRDSALSLPSWVPKYGRATTGEVIGQERSPVGGTRLNKMPFACATFLDPQLSLSPFSDDILVIRGYKIHKIKLVYEEAYPNKFGSPLSKDPVSLWLKNLLELCSAARSLPRGKFINESIWRVLTCDLEYGTSERASLVNAVYYREFCCALGLQIDDPTYLTEQTSGVSNQGSHHFEFALRDASLGRLFCVSDEGFLGWVPQKARVGDLICTFFGGAVPFIIRPEGDEGKNEFKLIGDCYIHGIMDGEISHMERLVAQDFRLI